MTEDQLEQETLGWLAGWLSCSSPYFTVRSRGINLVGGARTRRARATTAAGQASEPTTEAMN
nr:hypothetical protein [Pseudomonas sp. A46]